MLLIVNSSDQIKINNKTGQIKAMIESFTIKEEKFINEIYYLNLGVSFNKKQILKFLEIKNIFHQYLIKNFCLFQSLLKKKKDLFIFNNNKLYDEWLSYNEIPSYKLYFTH